MSFFDFNFFIEMDLSEQLKKLFPDHQPSNEPEEIDDIEHELFVQKEPMICKYEKRKGKPTTIIEGYEGEEEDFKILAKEIKTKLSVGGSFKDGAIIIQGDYRDKIMTILKDKGFKTKRVGG
jgi:translation initiation factor 1